MLLEPLVHPMGINQDVNLSTLAWSTGTYHPILMLRMVTITNPESLGLTSLGDYALCHLNTFLANYSTKETAYKIMKSMILERRVLLRYLVTILPTVCHGALFLFFLSFPT